MYKFLGGIYIFILSACSVNGSFQGLVSNYKKTKQLNNDLFIRVSQNNNCEVDSLEPKIHITNGIYLRECLSKSKNRVLVYNWAPKCKSEYCISLDLLQSFCNEQGYELFVVAEYYNHEEMDKQYILQNPIYGIDVKYYKTNYTRKYTTRFYSDLLQTNLNDMFISDYLLFEKSAFKGSFRSIDELEKFEENF